jgi:hypothetical protein
MAAKKKLKKTTKQVAKTDQTDETFNKRFARTVLGPTVNAAATVHEYGKSFGEVDLGDLIDALSEQTDAVLKGDLGRAETMLVAQAHTLDAIFNNLAQRAVRSEYLNQLDAFLKVALRAQAQSRATWEAVAAIKNPSVFGYVKQANIAHGPQQVNNAYDSGSEGNGNKQSKVMEKKDGEWVDTGASSAAVSNDSTMAAVEEIDRPNHKGRKS